MEHRALLHFMGQKHNQTKGKRAETTAAADCQALPLTSTFCIPCLLTSTRTDLKGIPPSKGKPLQQKYFLFIKDRHGRKVRAQDGVHEQGQQGAEDWKTQN